MTPVQREAGQELRGAECLPRGEQALGPCGLGGLGAPANPIYGGKVGLPAAIMELTKPETDTVKNAKGKGEGRGRRNPEPGDLSVSVFKEANVDFPGKYLEHFKRNGNCLKGRANGAPGSRQPGWDGCDEQQR